MNFLSLSILLIAIWSVCANPAGSGRVSHSSKEQSNALGEKPKTSSKEQSAIDQKPFDQKALSTNAHCQATTEQCSQGEESVDSSACSSTGSSEINHGTCLDKYTELGSLTYPIGDPAYCKHLVGCSRYRDQVKVARVTLNVLITCRLYPQNYPNLKKLFVFVDGDGMASSFTLQRGCKVKNEHLEVPSEVPRVWPTHQLGVWGVLNKTFTNIEELDVFNYSGEGVLVKTLLYDGLNNRLGSVREILDSKKVNVNRGQLFRGAYYVRGWTPIMFCFLPTLLGNPINTGFNVRDCVELFLNHGAEIIIESDGWELLSLAAILPTNEVLQLMIAKNRAKVLERLNSSLWHSVGIKHPLLAAIEGIRYDVFGIPNYMFLRPSEELRQQSMDDFKLMYAHAIANRNHPFFTILPLLTDLRVTKDPRQVIVSALETKDPSFAFLLAMKAHPGWQTIRGSQYYTGYKLLEVVKSFWANQRKAAIQNLLSTGLFHIETRDEYGRTPLMYSVSRGTIEDVGLLIMAGAHLNVRDNTGYNALSAIIAYTDTYHVRAKMLIDAGSPLTDLTRTGSVDASANIFELLMSKMFYEMKRGHERAFREAATPLMQSVLRRLPTMSKESEASLFSKKSLEQMMEILDRLGNRQLIEQAISKLPASMAKWYELVERRNGRWGVRHKWIRQGLKSILS